MAVAQTVKRKKKRDWYGLGFMVLFLLPALVILSTFMFYPIKETFRLSFMRSSGFGEELYVGWLNYQRIFASPEFRQGFVNVFRWAFWSVVIQIPLAFFIAFTCVNFRTRLIGRLRGVYYLSNVLPSAITAMLGVFIFSPTSGVIKTFAKTAGWKWLERIDWLGNPNIAFWSLFALATWAYMGFGIIYLMANIEQIPLEIRDAALIDGATQWQYAWRIVIPYVSYALRVQAILATVGSIKLFDLPYMVTLGGPRNATVTLGITLYREAFLNWQYGRGAAIGVVIFLICLVITIFQFSFVNDHSSTGESI